MWAQLYTEDGSTIIQQEDGSPFLWLGGTAWELFHVLDREDAVYYLDNRKEKGFTLIQAVILAEMDGLNKPNAYGDCPLINGDPARPNEAYFKHVDYIIAETTQRGMYTGLLPTWGTNVARIEGKPPVFTPENAYLFGKFLGERYKDDRIVWILGG